METEEVSRNQPAGDKREEGEVKEEERAVLSPSLNETLFILTSSVVVET